MLIIGDARLPAPVRKKLASFGMFIPFMTRGITYEAVSGHPDLFFCSFQKQLIVAPNLPEQYFVLLNDNGIDFVKGTKPVGKSYPEIARYNVVITDKYLIHNNKYTDNSIRQIFQDREWLPVHQGYTRCNLMALSSELFITSDKGIFKELKKKQLDVHYFSPEGIILEGFEYGFLGGCLGFWGSKIFVSGKFSHYREGNRLMALLKNRQYDIVELYDGPLIDGGSLFFLD